MNSNATPLSNKQKVEVHMQAHFVVMFIMKKIFACVLIVYLLWVCFMTATVDANLLRSFIVNWLDSSHVLHLSKPALIQLLENRRSRRGFYGMRVKVGGAPDGGKLLKGLPLRNSTIWC